MMVVVMKKDQMWIKRRNINKNIQRKKINHLRRQHQSDQGDNQQLGGLIVLSQLYGGNCMRPRLAHSFSESRTSKERDGLTSNTRKQLTPVSLRWSQKRRSRHIKKGQ